MYTATPPPPLSARLLPLPRLFLVRSFGTHLSWTNSNRIVDSAEVQAIEDADLAASQDFDRRSTAKASYTPGGTFSYGDPDAGKAAL